MKSKKNTAKKSITVVVAEPGKLAEMRDIACDFDSLRSIIGGYVQALPFGRLRMYVNEDGRALNLPINRLLSFGNIVGTIVVSKVSHAGNGLGLTADEALDAMVRLNNCMAA